MPKVEQDVIFFGKSLYHVTNLLEIKILAFTYVHVLLTIVKMNFLI